MENWQEKCYYKRIHYDKIYGKDKEERVMRLRRRLKRKMRRFYYLYLADKKDGLILLGLILFVFVGTIYCVKADREIAEQKRIQAELLEEQKAEEDRKKAEKEKQKAKEERDLANSVQPGVPVGTYEQSDEKIVYLTFDDGPSENTKKILDILDKHDVKATFFVTGFNVPSRQYIKEAYEAGHTVGLHSYTHDYGEIYASEEAYFDDLEKIGDMVEEQIGFVPCFIRFPGGASNTISSNYNAGIMSKLTEKVIDKGYQYYDWNYDSRDGGNPNAEQVYQNAIGCTENEIVLLFHDSQPKDYTVKALPKVIEHYKERGYAFKAITRESYVPHHSVNN